MKARGDRARDTERRPGAWTGYFRSGNGMGKN